MKLKRPIITRFIWATEVYAIIRLKSVWRIAVNDVYTIPIIANKYTTGVKKKDAWGNKGKEKRKKPYVPNFNKIPAKITEPDVGASTCASGNHKWTGTIGTLVAKELKKENHKNFCSFLEKIKVNKTS